MGIIRKSTGITIDISSSSAAPVSPAGTVRIRPHASAGLEYSYNGAAYTGFGGGGGTPLWNAITNPTGDQALTMGGYATAWTWDTAINPLISANVHLKDTSDSAGGSLLRLETTHTDTLRYPLYVLARGAPAFMVSSIGNVGVGADHNDYKFYLTGNAAQVITSTATSGSLTWDNRRLTISPPSSGTALHTLAYDEILFGNAFSTGNLKVRKTYVLHDQAANIGAFMGEELLYHQTAGQTQVITGHYFQTNVSAGTTILAVGADIGLNTEAGGAITTGVGAQVTLDGSGGTFTTGIGLRLLRIGTFGFAYGTVTSPGMRSGFGTLTPTASMHVLGAPTATDDAPALIVDTASTSGDTNLAVWKHNDAVAGRFVKADVTLADDSAAKRLSWVLGNGALKTNAVRGFLYLPSMPGQPVASAASVDAFDGTLPIVADSTNNTVWLLSGGAWRDLGAGGAGGGYATVQDEGTGVTARTILNFVGNVVAAADDAANTRTNVTINAVTQTAGNTNDLQYRTGQYTLGALAPSGTNTTLQWTGSAYNWGSAYITVQEDGVGVTPRHFLNFTGNAVSVADNGGTAATDVTINAVISTGGTGTELQYRTGATTLGAVTNSSVTAGDLTLGKLKLTYADGLPGLLSLEAYNDVDGAPITFTRSRGTPGSKSGVVAGDAFGHIYFTAYYSSSALREGASIRAAASDNWATDYFPTKLIFSTNDTTFGPTDRMWLTSEGYLGLGSGNNLPAATLDVSGTVRFDLGSDNKGDIYYRTLGGDLARLAIGTDGQVLQVASGLPAWGAGGAGGGYATVQDEGGNLTARLILNFTGNVVAAADDAANTRTNVTINAVTQTAGSTNDLQYRTGQYTLGALAPSGTNTVLMWSGSAYNWGSAYITVQDEGVGVTARRFLNFTGNAVSVADNGGTAATDVTISAVISVAGTGTELQYRTGATTLGAVTNSSVTAGDLTLAKLKLTQSDGLPGLLSLEAYNNVGGSNVTFTRSRGTPGFKSAVLAGDDIGNINFDAYYSSSALRTGATIRAAASDNWATNYFPAKLIFSVNDTAFSPTDRMWLTSEGRLGLGSGNNLPTATLHVIGTTRLDGTVSVNTPSLAGYTFLLQPFNTTSIGMSVRSGFGQTAHIFTLEDSGGSAYARWTASGVFHQLQDAAFGHSSPQARLHVSGSVRLDIDAFGAQGDMYYRSVGGTVARLAAGTEGHVLTLSDGLPSWAAASGGGGSPGGSDGGSIQYRVDSTTFGGESELWWDAATNRQGIRTNTPGYPLHIISGALATEGQSIFIEGQTGGERILFRSANDAQGPFITFHRAQGTLGSPTEPVTDAILGGFGAAGWFNGSWATTAKAAILFNAAATWAFNSTPTYFSFATTPVGATSRSERMRIADDGEVGINVTDPQARLHVSGSVRFDLGSDNTGDLFYRNSGGTLTRIPIGSNGYVLKVSSGLPVWDVSVSSGYTTVQDEGSGVSARQILNFVGNVVAATDDAGNVRTNVTINAVTQTSGSGTELQYRTGTYTLGAVPSSSITGGYLTLPQLKLTQSDGSPGLLSPEAYNNTAGSLVTFTRSRGTPGSKSGVLTGDDLGNINFDAYYSSSALRTGASIRAVASDNWGTNYFPTKLIFATNSTSFSPTDWMALSREGWLAVGHTSPGTALDVQQVSATTAAPVIIQSLDIGSSGTPTTGFGLGVYHRLESSTTANQVAAQIETRWQNATHSTRSAVHSIKTLHKASATLNERAIYGIYKDLTDGDLPFVYNDLFQFAFGVNDKKGVTGYVNITIIAKSAAGNDIQVYGKRVPFTAYHVGTTGAVGGGQWGTEFAAHGLTSAGGIGITFSTNGATGNHTVVFRVSTNTDFTSIESLFCIMDIHYCGEIDLQLL